MGGALMRVLGVDPGATTGWCLYESDERRVLDSGQFEENMQTPEFLLIKAHHAVIEQPKGYGPTRPQLVDCAWIAGRLYSALQQRFGFAFTHALTRRDVKNTLTEATQRDVVVVDDATAWAALKLLHGDGCDKKGGKLHGVRAHERAALACAVAWALRQGVATEAK